MACDGAETHLLGIGVRLGLYLQGIAFSVIIFRGVLWRSRAISDITLVTFIALVRSPLSSLLLVLAPPVESVHAAIG